MSHFFLMLCIMLTVSLGTARRTGRRCFDCHGAGNECAYPDTVSSCMVHEFTCSTVVTETPPDPENPDAKVYNVVRQCGRGPLAYKALVPGSTYAHSSVPGTRCVTTTDTDAEFEGGGMIVECWCQTNECNNQDTVTLPDGTDIQLASEESPAHVGQSSSDE